jgi:signal transduction histidine kinase
LLHDVGDAGASIALLLMALLSGAFVRQRRERALEQERLHVETIAAADARREADVLQERARLAREIHDVLAHTLAGLMIQLERTRLLAADLPGADEVVQQVARAHAMAAGGLTEANEAVGALRDGPSLDDEAITKLTNDFADATGVTVELHLSGDSRGLGPERRVLLYRAVQEALTNASKHASPTGISVQIDYRADDVMARIENDGRAPEGDRRDPSTGSVGFGLRGMRERVALLGGHLEAHPTQAGYVVAVSVPR